MSKHVTFVCGILACAHCSAALQLGDPVPKQSNGAFALFTRAHGRCVAPGMCACIRCGVVKPKTREFFYPKGLPGRLDSQCKVCRNGIQNEARRKRKLAAGIVPRMSPRPRPIAPPPRLLPVPDTPFRTVWHGGNPFEAKA